MYEDQLVCDNPNELTLLETEIIHGKLDGELITNVMLFVEGEWKTQFGLTDTSMLVLFHKLKRVCQLKGLL